ncbi:MAG: hypothetical protein ACI4VG_03830 [Lachnospiraceae bacterium]
MNSLFLLIILFSCCGSNFFGNRGCCGNNFCGEEHSRREECGCREERRDEGCRQNPWGRDNNNRGGSNNSERSTSCGCDRPAMGPSCPPPPPMPRNQFSCMDNEPRTCGCEEQ